MADSLNLAEALLRGHGTRVAVSEPTRAWTYEELSDTVARLGAALVHLGIKPGDRVAVLMPDGLEAATAILATIYMGGVAVPLSELGRANDVRAFVRHCDAVCVVVHESLEPVLDEVRGECPSVREVIVVGAERGSQRSFDGLVAGTKPGAAAPTAPQDVALLLYSTIPSDRLRGVPTTHEAPLEGFRAYGQGVLGLTANDKVFGLARLATAYGLANGLVYPLAAGAQAIFLPQQAKSRPVFDVLAGMRPTVLVATPSLYMQLLTDLAHARQGPLPAELRACVSSGETIPAQMINRMSSHFGVDVLPGYGLTESFSFVLATPPGKARPGSSGQPVPGFEARVVGEDGKPLGPHEIGTLQVRGPTVANGYWKREDESKITFRDGWLHTADRFFYDGDGYFFHSGRTDDLFKVGGKWVSPTEVERTLLGHEAVWECAVIGVEDEEGLTKPIAFVVPNVGSAPGNELEKELMEYVKREIAPYKYPRWIEFVPSLPKSPLGKILRYKLRSGRMRRSPTLPPA